MDTPGQVMKNMILIFLLLAFSPGAILSAVGPVAGKDLKIMNARFSMLLTDPLPKAVPKEFAEWLKECDREIDDWLDCQLISPEQEGRGFWPGSAGIQQADQALERCVLMGMFSRIPESSHFRSQRIRTAMNQAVTPALLRIEQALRGSEPFSSYRRFVAIPRHLFKLVVLFQYDLPDSQKKYILRIADDLLSTGRIHHEFLNETLRTPAYINNRLIFGILLQQADRFYLMRQVMHTLCRTNKLDTIEPGSWGLMPDGSQTMAGPRVSAYFSAGWCREMALYHFLTTGTLFSLKDSAVRVVRHRLEDFLLPTLAIPGFDPYLLSPSEDPARADQAMSDAIAAALLLNRSYDLASEQTAAPSPGMEEPELNIHREISLPVAVTIQVACSRLPREDVLLRMRMAQSFCTPTAGPVPGSIRYFPFADLFVASSRSRYIGVHLPPARTNPAGDGNSAWYQGGQALIALWTTGQKRWNPGNEMTIGITCPPGFVWQSRNPDPTSFSGGLRLDDENGCCAFSMPVPGNQDNADRLSGKKSVFVFGERVVLIGSGLRFKGSGGEATNQDSLAGTTLLSVFRPPDSVAVPDRVSPGVHDRSFNPPCPIGGWYSRALRSQPDPVLERRSKCLLALPPSGVEGDCYRLVQPWLGRTHEYAVQLSPANQAENSTLLEVVAASDRAHIVRDSRNGIMQAAFFEAATIENIEVSIPALLAWRHVNHEMTLCLYEPSFRERSQVEIAIPGSFDLQEPVSACRVSRDRDRTRIRIGMRRSRPRTILLRSIDH